MTSDAALRWADNRSECLDNLTVEITALTMGDRRAFKVLAAEVRRLQKELEAAHFVRAKIEDAPLAAARADQRSTLKAVKALQVECQKRIEERDTARAEAARMRERFEYVLHNAGLINDLARGWNPEKHPPLIDWIRASVEAALEGER